MPKMLKFYKDKQKAKKIRKKWRRENYEKGRFGNRRKSNKFNSFEKVLIKTHIFSDRWTAYFCGSSTNGIQSMRWRLNNNYKRLYK